MPRAAAAHPVPFSYLDLRLQDGAHRRHAGRPHLRPRARPRHRPGRTVARSRRRLAAVGGDRAAVGRAGDGDGQRRRAHPAVVVCAGRPGSAIAEARGPLPDVGASRNRRRDREDVSVRSAAPDVPQHLRGVGADPGDPRWRPHQLRVLRRHPPGRLRRGEEIPAGRHPSHPDRPGSPAIPGRAAAARRLDPAARGHRHLLHRRAQHHAVARRAQPRSARRRGSSSRRSPSASSTSAPTTC